MNPMPMLFPLSIRRQGGFTLAEMAIVVVIMGIMLTAGLSMLNAQLDTASLSKTREKQKTVQAALLQHLRAQGRLPCPDTKLAPDGQAVGPPCLADNGRGVVPWLALGLPRDAAVDGWGNFFTYRVANDNPATGKNWTDRVNDDPFTLGEFTAAALNPASANLLIQERNTAGVLMSITDQAVVVLLSHGKNAYGARKQSGATEAAPPVGNDDESTNATVTGTGFVARPWTEEATAAGGPFDDVVLYLRPHELLGPLMDEKTLKGGCQAYCAVPGPACGFADVPVGLAAGTCP